MALSDPYISLADYKSRVGKTGTGDDGVLTELLKAVSRHLDLECGDREGGRFFSQDDTAQTRLYDGNGLTRLYIDDIATDVGLIVQVDLDGDWDFTDPDETLTIDTHFWLGPANADKGPEARPWRYLDIVPNNGRLTSWARLTVWPTYGLPVGHETVQKRAVQVTAKFGWPAVPQAIMEAVTTITHELVGFEQGGASAALQNVDQAIRLSPTSFSLVQRIKSNYSRKGLFV